MDPRPSQTDVPPVTSGNPDNAHYRSAERGAARRSEGGRGLEADAKFEALFNQSGVFAGIMDLDGVVREVNELSLRACGYERKEVVGLLFWETPWWRGSAAVQERIRVAVRTTGEGGIFKEVLPYWVADGTERTTEFAMHPIRDRDGRILFLNPTGIDITERVRAERALAESEKLWRALVMASSDSVYRMSADWSEMRRLDGRGVLADTAEPTTSWMERYIHPDDRPRVSKAIRQSIETGTPFELEHRVWLADGSLGFTQSRAVPLRDADGRIIEWIGIASDVTERRRTESDLRESEERYRGMVTQMIAGIAEVDPAGRFKTVNQRYCEITGYTREELLAGMRMQEITSPDDLPGNIELFKRLAQTGEPFTIEKRYIRKDGHAVWVRNSVSAVRDEGGELRSIIAVSIDITDRKEVEGALRRSEGRYRALFESVDEGFCILKVNFDDPDNMEKTCASDYLYLEANPAFFRHTGFSPDAVGRTIRDLVPQINEEWMEIYGAVAKTGVPRRVEYPAPAMNRWFSVYAFRIGDPGDHMVAVLFTDITSRQKKEQERIERERRLVEVLEQAPAFMAVLRGPNFVFEHANSAYLWAVGRRHPEDLVGKPLIEAMPELRGQPFLNLLQEVYRTGTPYKTPQGGVTAMVRFAEAGQKGWERRSELETLTMEFVYMPLREEDGRISGVLVHGIDLTDRVRAEESLRRHAATLERANADLLQFSSAASHDLKEPLRGISRLASFIAEDEPSLSAEGEERLKRIGILCARLTTMVTGLIQFARIGGGGGADGEGMRRGECDLNLVVRQVIDNAAEQLREKGAEVVIRGVLPTIDADCGLMERVFANLVANGVKFNDSVVKRVEIYEEPTDAAGADTGEDARARGGKRGDVAIVVRDNGIGIEPRHTSKVFGLFRRLNSPERYAGEGLGLPLAKKIIELHGGKIRFESSGVPGEGTAFRITLPRKGRD